MERGKHVYCEKPLAHSIAEVRELRRVATENKVVTQLGNQGHSFDHIRLFCEWIWDGAIGDVHTIHASHGWRGRSYSRIEQIAATEQKHEVPETLNWDLWLGPAAMRPYNPVYLPGSWRGWLDFGTGCVGDWICHVVDPVFWRLILVRHNRSKPEVVDYSPEKHATESIRRVRRFDTNSRQREAWTCDFGLVRRSLPCAGAERSGYEDAGPRCGRARRQRGHQIRQPWGQRRKSLPQGEDGELPTSRADIASRSRSAITDWTDAIRAGKRLVRTLTTVDR